jgi:hypothetical protein
MFLADSRVRLRGFHLLLALALFVARVRKKARLFQKKEPKNFLDRFARLWRWHGRGRCFLTQK